MAEGGLNGKLARNLLIYWRSLPDSNRCYSLERALFEVHQMIVDDKIRLEK